MPHPSSSRARLDALVARGRDIAEAGLFALPGLGAHPNRPAPMRLAFAFDCFGIPFQAHMERDAARANLAVEGLLGPVPYSIEAPRARREVRAVMREAATVAGARLVVDGAQQLRIAIEARLPLPVTPVEILLSTVATLFALKPYVMRLAAVLPGAEAEARIGA